MSNPLRALPRLTCPCGPLGLRGAAAASAHVCTPSATRIATPDRVVALA